MAKAKPKPTDWKGRLKAELQRDKKKTAILAALLATAEFVGGRIVVTHSISGASAEQPRHSAAEVEDGNDVQKGAPQAHAAPRSTARADRAERAEYVSRMDRTIHRDLFHANLDYFAPLPGAEDLSAARRVEDPGWFGTMWRRVLQKQQAGSDELARIRALRARARALSLQSTMMGPSATALIDGQVLHKGDYISGFRVKSIASGCCVVTKDGVDVELRMD